MTTTQVRDIALVEAFFVGGPVDGTTASIDLESTGFPPAHVSIPDADGVTRHLYSALIGGEASLTLFCYLGPLSS
jgi:hypothetical protein